MPTSGVRWVARLPQRLEVIAHGVRLPQTNHSAQPLTKARIQSGKVTAF